MKFVFATSEDFQEVFSLLVELRKSGYREMGIPLGEINIDDSIEKYYSDLLGQKHVSIVLAKDTDLVVGLALLVEVPKILDGKNRLIIEELVVRDGHRGLGIGSKLLGHIEQIARQKKINIVKVTSGTKLKANEFYKKHGYIYFENAYRKSL